MNTKLGLLLVVLVCLGAGCTSVSSKTGVLDVTSDWKGTWVGTTSTQCVDARGHGGLVDQCYDSKKEEPPVFTMEFRIPDDLCTGYYRCRVVDSTCTTLLYKKPWNNCLDCYSKCKKGDGYDDGCFKKCVTEANKEFVSAK